MGAVKAGSTGGGGWRIRGCWGGVVNIPPAAAAGTEKGGMAVAVMVVVVAAASAGVARSAGSGWSVCWVRAR